jgi:hypothetical protein
MKRREFISTTALTAGSMTISNGLFAVAESGTAPEDLTVKEFHQYLRSLAEVREPSVDQIIIGNPDAMVRKVGTAWLPYLKTIHEAIDRDVNLLIVHEPTFTHTLICRNPTMITIAPNLRSAYYKARDQIE